jgi:hypothetical protein
MNLKTTIQANQSGVPASLSAELLDKLADLVAAKLIAKNDSGLLPKQDVVGSNPITRSIQGAAVARTHPTNPANLRADLIFRFRADPVLSR